MSMRKTDDTSEFAQSPYQQCIRIAVFLNQKTLIGKHYVRAILTVIYR